MLRTLTLGQSVYWSDPEHISSGTYTVKDLYSEDKTQTKISNLRQDHLVLIANDYSETLVFVSELFKSAPNI